MMRATTKRFGGYGKSSAGCVARARPSGSGSGHRRSHPFPPHLQQQQQGVWCRAQAEEPEISVSDEDLPPLDLLKKENELLRQAIESAGGSVNELEEELEAEGVSLEGVAQVPADEEEAEAEEGEAAVAEEEEAAPAASGKPDWSPVQVQPAGHHMEEIYGEPQNPTGDGTECLRFDPTLWSHAGHIKERYNRYCNLRYAIDTNEGGLDNFSKGYEHFGFNRGTHEEKEGIWYREWAPNAKALALVGDFNDWEPQPEHWAFKNEFGVWELFLPDIEGKSAIPHRSRIKCRIEAESGEWLERIPAWIKWATQAWDEVQFNGCYWEPEGTSEPGVFEQDKKYQFKYNRPKRPANMRIYECHVGMSSKEPKVNSYLEFKDDVLPRIKALGYNTIQIMAIQEHAYYGSFGYHVTNFFGVSSRSGTPDELKAMIDEAHRLGLFVLIDIVHSHASSNSNDGINLFDGSGGQYFHEGAKGYHWMWDSRLFNYGNWEVMRFLLSNCRWWLDEYKFDGFRFDGVTSMMYHHHGLQMAFTGNYDEYFGMQTDLDSVVYLMIANDMIHSLFPNAVTIGEDVSGMPTFCRPVQEGGVGFDYRLNMAIADKWIDIMETSTDEYWGMGDICHTLTNRRYGEACIGYAESHDQALVGDKTIAFWLMDAEMYYGMEDGTHNDVVSRGIALHKMIRCISSALGGEGYLNFMGNEFGHPEWIDFPRDDTYDTSTGEFIPGNGGSHDKCRRRWDLADSDELKYKYMNSYDRALMHLDKAFGFFNAPHTFISRKDEMDKLIVFERGDLVFVLNFHPTNSYSDYRVGCCNPGAYKVVLSSDEGVFGGWNNVSKWNDAEFHTQDGDYDSRPCSMQVYAPSRTAVVYAPADWCDYENESVVGLGVKDVGPYFNV
mmetsp:Transcript_39286/g.84109  ORF Transcript_39286/g.84109 Transcript_39286/m.84109 type:complete len:891 (+) Transcript_39286:181-2853(+)